MDKNYQQFKQKFLFATGILLLTALIVVILFNAFYVFLLIFASIVAAVVLRGLAEQISKPTKLPKKTSLILVIVSLFIICIGTILLLGPSVSEGFQNLRERLPQAIEQLQDYITRTEIGKKVLENIEENDFFSESNMANQAWGVFSTALGALIGILVVFIVSLYLSFDTKLYTLNGVVKLFPFDKREKVINTLSAMATALRWWILGQFGSMVIIGTLTWLGLSILGVPLALTLGILAGLLTFVPNLGPIIASIPTLLVALSISPATALYTLILYTVLQNLEGYFITPMIEKKAVSLPPALLILFQLLMGVLLGAFGLILAAPLLVVVMVLVQLLYVKETLEDDIKVLGE
jgi:predicted PurR-regulated permease PerM